MKKLTTILLLLCLVIFAAGCTETTDENANATEEITDEVTGETSTLPTDTEMKALFDEAYTIYQWFDMAQLENDGEMYTLSDGTICSKVTDNAVSSMTELESNVRAVFADDLADELLNSGLYLEEDGILYVQIADRGSDITKGDILSEGITAATDTTITYTVTVEIVDPETTEVTGSEDIDFICELIDGAWLFTEFKSIY